MPSLHAPRLVLPDGSLVPGAVAIQDGRIADVREGAPRRGDEVLGEGLLAPGFVDWQVNGAFGIDCPTASPARLARLARALPAHGVTAFLPTVITAPLAAMTAALERIGAVRPDGGARILGAHAEGPFLSPEFPGAHPPEHLRDPDPEAVAALLGAGPVRVLTLAPERPGAGAAIAAARRAGAVVSIGHSAATAAQTAAAGATMVTHLFNAQRGLHHREPGVAGRALVDETLTLGLIADGVHVAPDVLRLVFAAAGHRVALVSDAVAAAGTRTAPAVRGDGTLTGSVALLDAGVRTLVAAGVPLAAALRAATRTPADALGEPDLGRLAPGAHADLVWLGNDLRVRAAWVAGRRAYAVRS